MNNDNLHTSFPKHKIKILLLENISPVAVEILRSESFQVDTLKGTLSEAELISKVGEYHAIGIRSRTQITEAILRHGKKLLAIGCFCIGTNQVDLNAAELLGIPVFNSPFSNSRSVAELIIAEVIALSRKMCDRNLELHQGTWRKSAAHCHEIRGRTLGIIGYGHIGSQLSVIAESLGMKVIFFDVATVMPHGLARPCLSLDEVLKEADYVTCHVPETPLTKGMIGQQQIALMKRGAYLLNASRGSVVDIAALQEALLSGHLAGAAIDVYPEEPESDGSGFVCQLQHCPNTILTPHIGGSTEEAQHAIGIEVASAIVKLINTGRTIGAVNFPNCDLYISKGTHRILNIHKNVPGVMKQINSVLEKYNIKSQLLDTSKHTGYLIIDVDQETSHDVKKQIAALPISLRTRILY